MFDTARIKEDFGKAAAHYDDNARLQQTVLQKLLERAKPLWPGQALVLDAGCGTGWLARQRDRERIIQLDISYPMCAKASQNQKPAINASIENLPFADGTFDVVFSSLALQWLPESDAGIRELRRVLKPGGILAISTFGEKTLHELRNSFAAIDNAPHVSPFIRADEFWHKEIIVEYFSDLASIMRSLKAIGANNKLSTRRKTMMTPGKLRKIEDFYWDNYSDDSGLPVTWEILYSAVSCR